MLDIFLHSRYVNRQLKRIVYLKFDGEFDFENQINIRSPVRFPLRIYFHSASDTEWARCGQN